MNPKPPRPSEDSGRVAQPRMNESPFSHPEMMDGYPLSKEEHTACERVSRAYEMTMRPSELCGVRDAMRTMPTLIQSLNSGEIEKYVLMKRGRVVAVLLDVDTYSEMVKRAR